MAELENLVEARRVATVAYYLAVKREFLSYSPLEPIHRARLALIEVELANLNGQMPED